MRTGRWRLHATALLGAVLLGLLAPGVLVAPAAAEEWNSIAPGTTTMDSVRARFGPPVRTTPQKVEGYDTMQWVYDGNRAPSGLKRMVVDFGLLTPSGYRAEIVRAFRLEPHKGVFTRRLVLAGWGEPTRVSPAGAPPPAFFYESGLLVEFDSEGQNAETMIFTAPQRLPDAATPPR